MGPAAKSGIKEGDVIVGLGEVDGAGSAIVPSLLALRKPGRNRRDQIAARAGYLNVPVTLIERGKNLLASAQAHAAGHQPTPLPPRAADALHGLQRRYTFLM